MGKLRSVIALLLLAALLTSVSAWGRGQGRHRGRYATLRGIRVGKVYPLVNPSTGKVDHKARVVARGFESFKKVPYATVRFSNGYKEDVAAERLHLVGKPFGEKKRYMKWQKQVVAKAVRRELGLDGSKVPVTTMNGRPYAPRKRARKKPAYLGPFLTFYGEGLKPGEGLNGYQWEGKVYLSRNYSAFDYQTRTHEVLHALSEPFAQQAMDRGFTNVMEGINQYFTYHVARSYFGVKLDPDHPYIDYFNFAREVAGVVGHDRLKRIVFGKQGNLFSNLARKVDCEVGKRGAFTQACRTLEQGEPTALGAAVAARIAASPRRVASPRRAASLRRATSLRWRGASDRHR